MTWLEKFPNIKSLFEADKDELLNNAIPEKYIDAIKTPNWQQIETDLKWLKSSNHHIVTWQDSDYPPLLKQITNPPLLLFVKGNLSALSIPQIAIVGSRHPTPMGLQNAEQFAFHLANANFAITSGLALGIDGACHKGCLQAQGITIGVKGTGLDFLYPKAHHSLMHDIVEKNGALISEFPLMTPPLAQNFPQRNRIIAGLAMGVLVVEATLRSGSLITARLALEEGREVFAIPGNIHNPQTRGCHHLIRQGATLVESTKEILNELGVLNTWVQSYVPLPIKAAYKNILKHFDHEVTPMDVLLERTAMPISELASILLKLELEGFIHSVPGGFIRKIAQQ